MGGASGIVVEHTPCNQEAMSLNPANQRFSFLFLSGPSWRCSITDSFYKTDA